MNSLATMATFVVVLFQITLASASSTPGGFTQEPDRLPPLPSYPMVQSDIPELKETIREPVEGGDLAVREVVTAEEPGFVGRDIVEPGRLPPAPSYPMVQSDIPELKETIRESVEGGDLAIREVVTAEEPGFVGRDIVEPSRLPPVPGQFNTSSDIEEDLNRHKRPLALLPDEDRGVGVGASGSSMYNSTSDFAADLRSKANGRSDNPEWGHVTREQALDDSFSHLVAYLDWAHITTEEDWAHFEADLMDNYARPLNQVVTIAGLTGLLVVAGKQLVSRAAGALAVIGYVGAVQAGTFSDEILEKPEVLLTNYSDEAAQYYFSILPEVRDHYAMTIMPSIYDQKCQQPVAQEFEQFCASFSLYLALK